MNLGEQIENELTRMLWADKPWWHPRRTHRFEKKQKIRLERRRAKKDLDCVPAYRKYNGYEW